MKGGEHIGPDVLDRYAAGGPGIGADLLWAVEVHLERCAACRSRLGEAATGAGLDDLLGRVRASLAGELARSTQMPRPRPLRRRAARWAPPSLWPWLVTTALVAAAALGLDLLDGGLHLPSLVLLVAPVTPLLGVAAVWTAGLDPAHELVVASPRAGLALVLRRTLAVLAVVVPALTAAGWLTGTSPARWLLPCLAFTAGALALGELIGLRRAAGALATAWTAGVITPSVLTARTPVLLERPSMPLWAGLLAAVTVALVLRRGAYTGLRRDRWFAR